MENMLQGMALEYLSETPIGIKAQNVMRILSNIQESQMKLAEGKDSENLKVLKVSMIATMEVLKKLAAGKSLKTFDSADFADVSDAVLAYAIKPDGQLYSEFIFTLYAKYIDYSAKALGQIKSAREKAKKIAVLAVELQRKAEQLHVGKITEVQYTEDCLWICLEAMVKLLSTYAGTFTDERATLLISGASDFAFEYGRLVLYQKEQTILTAYLDNQKQLDEDLQKQYEAYVAELNANVAQFTDLMTNAFTVDFRSTLENSVQLARAAGVKQEEILDSTDKIDDFFLN